jgi:uncharacterized membrane protein YfcA
VTALIGQLPAILAVVALAGLIQGLAGFGSALVAVPLLALLLPMPTLVPLMVLLGIAVSLLNLLHLHHALADAPLGRLLLGYLLGTPLGLLFLTRAPEPLVLGLLGLGLAAFALLSLAGRQPRGRWLREQRLAIGALSGALGAAYGTNGPPVILHVAAHPEWGSDRQKATLTLFFLVSGLLTAGAHWAGGLVTGPVLELTLWALPALLGGALAGVWLYRRLGEHDYRRMVFALVLLTGLMLLWRAVTGD